MNEKECSQCRIPQQQLECDGFCTWYCAFMDHHLLSKDDGTMIKWFSLNKKMLKEKDENIQNNREKLSLKMAKHMNDKQRLRCIYQMKFTSKTNNKTVYTACMYPTFDTCSCKAFKHRGNCRHIEELKQSYKLFNY